MAVRRLSDRIRERLDSEIGTVYKSHAGRLRVALAFPSTYYVGMSNLGLHTVYGLLNARDDTVCERAFLPDEPDLRRAGSPLITMESQSRVRDFDLLAFSLSYELDYPNVLRILSLSGIPPTSDERAELPGMPIVIAGGPAATFNPETMAPFIDVFVIGEAEEVLPRMVDLLIESQQSERHELLLALAHLPGVYVPRFYEPEYNDDGTTRRVTPLEGVPARVRRGGVAVLDDLPSTSMILTPETEFSNMILAEVARGCGRQCRFCVAGYAFLPPRSRSARSVLEGIRRTEELARKHGAEQPRVGVLSASVFDHPSSLLVCQTLAEESRLFSISSTRVDTLTRDVVQALHQGGHETLTIAPEAGTARLRCVINKVMTDEEIMQAAATAWDGGFRRLKLYFMVGLPTETSADIEAIHLLVEQVSRMSPWERLSVSVSCFVPKPWTPFQWAAMDLEKELGRKIAAVPKALRPLRAVAVGGESAREAVVQGVLARGDRRLRDALLALDAENVSWRAAFRQGNVDPAFYAQRSRYQDEVFPWDHIDLGVRKEYLWQEYERALAEAPTAPCEVGICRRCGVCR